MSQRLKTSFVRRLIVLAPFAIPAAASIAESPPRLVDCPELKHLAPRWEQAIKSLGAPGCAVVVVRGDQILMMDTFGIREPQDRKPVTPDTLFYIASCTKPYVAMAAAILADQGRLDLDAPVKKYLPRFALPSAELTEKVTVRDLLCHRHGISHPAIVFLDAYTGEITEDRYFHFLSQANVSGGVNYSNVHFTLAGRVIEAVSGKPWQETLDELVLKPAGMTRTTAYASRMYGDSDAALPLTEASGEWMPCAVRKTDRTMHAAGGMGTTITDLSRWLRLHLNAGKVEGRQVVSPAVVQNMLTLQSRTPEDGSIRRMRGFGLGWGVGVYRSDANRYVTHGGGYIGTSAHASMLPDRGIGVGILANADGPAQGLMAILSIDVYDTLLGVKGEDLLPTYANQASKHRRLAAKRAGSSSRPLTGTTLSRPIDEYAGTYSNNDWGTVRIQARDGALTLAVGDMPMTITPAETDHFVALDTGGDKTHGSFEAGADGRIAAVRMEMIEGQHVRFER